MDAPAFNLFCKSLCAATYINQWRDSHVWKVGGKVFAIGKWNSRALNGITFKVSDKSYEHLKVLDGLRPAPYFASRGLKWIQLFDEQRLPQEALQTYIQKSHVLAINRLTRRQRINLGFMK